MTRVPRPRPDPLLTALERNPHAARVISEHAYARTVSAAPINVQKRRTCPSGSSHKVTGHMHHK